MNFTTWTIWRQDRQDLELYRYAPGLTGRARFVMCREELIVLLNDRLGESVQKAIVACIDAGWHVIYDRPKNSLTTTPGLPEIEGRRDRRAYDTIRVLVEAEDGSIEFRRKGEKRYGAWVVQIRGREGKFQSVGGGEYCPEFNELGDTECENTLIPGAREKLLAKLE